MLHGPHTPLAVSGIEKRFAEPRRTPKIDLQNPVPAVGKPLHLVIQPPAVAGPRSAVNEEHQGHFFRTHAGRKGKITDQFEAVPRCNDERPHRGQGILPEIRPVRKEKPGGALLPVIQIK